MLPSKIHPDLTRITRVFSMVIDRVSRVYSGWLLIVYRLIGIDFTGPLPEHSWLLEVLSVNSSKSKKRGLCDEHLAGACGRLRATHTNPLANEMSLVDL